MRTNDVQDELAEGFEVGPLPPMGPDGAPALEPAKPLAQDPPRLCEAGPCRNYHTFQIQLDAQNPMAEKRPDGKIVQHGRVFHTEQHHYCYPNVGIESNLGSLPVLSCNRWVPLTGLLQRVSSVRRAYDARMAAWVAARDAEADEATAVIEGESVRFTVVARWREAPDAPVLDRATSLVVTGDTTIGRVIDDAMDAMEIIRGWDTSDPERALVELDGEPITNQDATVAQLGLSGTVTLTVTDKEIPKP